jgi:quinol monooxygenase YgiN
MESNMFIVIIKMKALPEKCLELKQTLQALNKSAQKEKGCLSHNVFRDIESDNSFSLVQMWQNRTDLDVHLRSDKFTVLIGTKSLLSQPPEITMNEVTHSSGWEAVEAVRK